MPAYGDLGMQHSRLPQRVTDCQLLAESYITTILICISHEK